MVCASGLALHWNEASAGRSRWHSGARCEFHLRLPGGNVYLVRDLRLECAAIGSHKRHTTLADQFKRIMGAHIECHASGSQSFNPTRKTNLCARRYRSTVFQVNAAAHDNLSFVVNVPLHFLDADRFDDGYEISRSDALNERLSVTTPMRQLREQRAGGLMRRNDIDLVEGDLADALMVHGSGRLAPTWMMTRAISPAMPTSVHEKSCPNFEHFAIRPYLRTESRSHSNRKAHPLHAFGERA